MEILFELYFRIIVLIAYCSIAYIVTKIFLSTKVGKKINKKLFGGR